MWSYHQCDTSDCLYCQLWCRAKNNTPTMDAVKSCEGTLTGLGLEREPRLWRVCSFKNNVYHERFPWAFQSEERGTGGQGLQMKLWTESKNKDPGTHLFGQQGDEVSLKLRLDHLHHMLDLCGLTAVNQLIQRQQLLWASPALEHTGQRNWFLKNNLN